VRAILRLSVAFALAALSVGVPGAVAVGAQPAAAITCQIVPFDPSSNFTGDHMMHDIDALATNDIWAVGEQDGDSGVPLAYHYNGHKWKRSSLAPAQPGWPYAVLNAVAARATNDVWAFGVEVDTSNTHMQLLIEHWNGHHWTFSSSFVIPGADDTYELDVNGAVAISARDAWVVGESPGQPPFAYHWNGIAWSNTTLPDGVGYLSDVTGSAAHGVWAIGGDLPNQSILHWDGSAWQTAYGLNDDLGILNRMDITKSGNVVAVGNADNKRQQVALAGPSPSWVSQVVPPTKYDYTQLLDVAVVSAKSIWAIGETSPHQFIQPRYPAVYRWNGSKWSQLTMPINKNAGEILEAMTSVPGSNQVYAVGYVDYGPYVSKDLLITRIC